MYVIKSVKHMGANKPDKIYCELQIEGTPRKWMNEYERSDPRGFALFLCKMTRSDFVSDRWWDVPSYRDEAIREYRGRIKAIRVKYGLSKSEVSDYMRV